MFLVGDTLPFGPGIIGVPGYKGMPGFKGNILKDFPMKECERKVGKKRNDATVGITIMYLKV